MRKTTLYEQVLELSDIYCDRWHCPPHVTCNVPFSLVCEAVADAAYLADVRDEREAKTPRRYTDESGRTWDYIPVGEY